MVVIRQIHRGIIQGCNFLIVLNGVFVKDQLDTLVAREKLALIWWKFILMNMGLRLCSQNKLVIK